MKQKFLALTSVIVLVLAMITFSAFVGYGQGRLERVVVDPVAMIAGKWHLEGAKSDAIFPSNMELLGDGTGIDEQQANGRGVQITWKVEGNRFYLLYGLGNSAIGYNYEISELGLSIISDDGASAVYKRPVAPVRPLGGAPVQSPVLQSPASSAPGQAITPAGMVTRPISTVPQGTMPTMPPQPLVLPNAQ